MFLQDNKRDQAQLIYDLLIENGFYDNFFEDRFFFLMKYKSEVKNEISENNILDFHLSHKQITNFDYQPKKIHLNLFGNICQMQIYFKILS